MSPDCVSAVADCVTAVGATAAAGAAIYATYIARKELRAWKVELRGRSEHDLAVKLWTNIVRHAHLALCLRDIATFADSPLKHKDEEIQADWKACHAEYMPLVSVADLLWGDEISTRLSVFSKLNNKVWVNDCTPLDRNGRDAFSQEYDGCVTALRAYFKGKLDG